jgi:dUTPase
MQFSDPETEHPFAFLSRTDMVIAGDTGILLEAALLNVYPLYYDFAQKWSDYYGFVQTGLVQHIESCAEACVVIRSHMQHKQYIRDRAKGFCATIDTPYDGQSAILASEIIVNVTQGNMGFLSKWKRISGLPIEAYELA